MTIGGKVGKAWLRRSPRRSPNLGPQFSEMLNNVDRRDYCRRRRRTAYASRERGGGGSQMAILYGTGPSRERLTNEQKGSLTYVRSKGGVVRKISGPIIRPRPAKAFFRAAGRHISQVRGSTEPTTANTDMEIASPQTCRRKKFSFVRPGLTWTGIITLPTHRASGKPRQADLRPLGFGLFNKFVLSPSFEDGLRTHETNISFPAPASPWPLAVIRSFGPLHRIDFCRSFSLPGLRRDLHVPRPEKNSFEKRAAQEICLIDGTAKAIRHGKTRVVKLGRSSGEK